MTPAISTLLGGEFGACVQALLTRVPPAKVPPADARVLGAALFVGSREDGRFLRSYVSKPEDRATLAQAILHGAELLGRAPPADLEAALAVQPGAPRERISLAAGRAGASDQRKALVLAAADIRAILHHESTPALGSTEPAVTLASNVLPAVKILELGLLPSGHRRVVDGALLEGHAELLGRQPPCRAAQRHAGVFRAVAVAWASAGPIDAEVRVESEDINLLCPTYGDRARQRSVRSGAALPWALSFGLSGLASDLLDLGADPRAELATERTTTYQYDGELVVRPFFTRETVLRESPVDLATRTDDVDLLKRLRDRGGDPLQHSVQTTKEFGLDHSPYDLARRVPLWRYCAGTPAAVVLKDYGVRYSERITEALHRPALDEALSSWKAEEMLPVLLRWTLDTKPLSSDALRALMPSYRVDREPWPWAPATAKLIAATLAAAETRAVADAEL